MKPNVNSRADLQRFAVTCPVARHPDANLMPASKINERKSAITLENQLNNISREIIKVVGRKIWVWS